MVISAMDIDDLIEEKYRGCRIVLCGGVCFFSHGKISCENSDLPSVKAFIDDLIVEIKFAVNRLPALFFEFPNKPIFGEVIGLQRGRPLIDYPVPPSEVPMRVTQGFGRVYLANEKAAKIVPLIAEKQNRITLLLAELKVGRDMRGELTRELFNSIDVDESNDGSSLDVINQIRDHKEKILFLRREVGAFIEEIEFQLKPQMDLVIRDMIPCTNSQRQKQKEKEKGSSPTVPAINTFLPPLAFHPSVDKTPGKIVIQNPELLKIDKNGKFK